MVTYKALVVGTDGSESADEAVDVAAGFAARLGRPLTIASVWSLDSGVQTEAEWLVGKAATAARRRTVPSIETVAMSGSPAATLIELAERTTNTLLVVGSRGLGSARARMVGSTSNNLSHHSLVDVCFVSHSPAQWGAIGLATDGSETSKCAVRRGYALATALGATPFLVTAAEDEVSGNRVLDAVSADLGIPAEGERDVLLGSASDALSHAGFKYDLLVLGNRGMSGPARLLGSVTNRVTHHAGTNLLLVNTHSAPADQS